MFTENTSVMVIDMQCPFMKPKSSKDLETKVPYQMKLLRKAREAGAPVIFIEYEGEGPTIPELPKEDGDIVVIKPYNNGFNNTHLEDRLSFAEIQSVHVIGCNALYCVKDTVLSGVGLDYEMIVHEQGILSYHSSKRDVKSAIKQFRKSNIQVI